MSAREISPGIVLLTGRPAYRINQYLVDDVLIDAGPPGLTRRLLRDLGGRPLSVHALTHGHPDHYGSSRALTERLGVPTWCPAGDAEAVRTRRLPHSNHPVGRLTGRMPGPPPPAIARTLHEGDEVAGFRVLDTPGHSPGHVSYWREADRVLIVGDVLFNVEPLSGRVGLREPPVALTVDPARNRDAIRRLAALEPEIALFGHGPPLRDPAALSAFAASLAG